MYYLLIIQGRHISNRVIQRFGGKSKMSQGNYAEEFKEHILSEHEAGVSVRELARRYEPSATTIQNWKRQAKAKASESEPGESEVAQLRRLQRRNQELEQENAFLKKAAAWFAADSGVQRGGTGRTN